MQEPCIDNNCYNLTKQLSKTLEFLNHSLEYVRDAYESKNKDLEKIWQTIIDDREKHAQMLRNQLVHELQKIKIPN
jgi:hypothetical protein